MNCIRAINELYKAVKWLIGWFSMLSIMTGVPKLPYQVKVTKTTQTG